MRRPVRSAVVFLSALCAAVILVPWSALAAEGQDPQMAEYGDLARQFDYLVNEGSKELSPQELAAACDELIDDFDDLIQAASANPFVKSKSQKLLFYVYGFAGREPERWPVYEGYLDTMESWQGREAAMRKARREGEMSLKLGNAPDAVGQLNVMLSLYPDTTVQHRGEYALGLAYMKLDAPTVAANRFEAAYQADPEGRWAAWALRKRAYALCFHPEEPSDLDAALAVLDDLAERFPTPHWLGYVHYRKGRILAAQGKPLEAIAEYGLGASEQPTSPYTRWGAKQMAALQERVEQEVLEQIAEEEEGPEEQSPDGVAEEGGEGGPVASMTGHGDLGLTTDADPTL